MPGLCLHGVADSIVLLSDDVAPTDPEAGDAEFDLSQHP